jgi:cyclophilin family peptidyl-prolyl cis-trans isomerase
MAVVDKIKAVATGNKGPHQNVPTTPVVITSATWSSNPQGKRHEQPASRTARHHQRRRHRHPGVITLELDAVKAPKSTANFLAYVNKGHYDGTIFHRVIKAS